MTDVIKSAGKDVSEQKRKRTRKTRAQRYKEKQPRSDYQLAVRDNENLEKYYKLQPFLLDGEFEEFMKGLKETLPASFRINSFDINHANFLKRMVEGPELSQFLAAPSNDDKKDENHGKLTMSEDKATKPILEPLSWYPRRFGWQMNFTRLDLKKISVLQQFHKFLMAETDNGFISRQEAVSMIPPLLLDVHRGQNILDMCAAPGSKTAQLLEYLKFDIFDTGDPAKTSSTDLFDDGLVVANDIDNKRCYMLVHQSSRLNSPNCIVINQDASRLPDMKLLAPEGQEDPILKFDRVLCDVPCTGDGTIRKNPDVWKKWSVANSNNFHGMQCKILKRGIELLKENGLLVYSTCSMNPIEDEAVIASLLRAAQNKVVLEDVAHKLVGLKYRPGANNWVVMGKAMEIIPSPEQVPAENATQIYPGLFPPTKEEISSFNLHRCLRILPHLNNTGGFFVAVLRKLAPTMPWEVKVNEARTGTQSECSANENGEKSGKKPSSAPNPRKRRFGGFKEDPFFFMDDQDPDWIAIKNGYGLSDTFPVGQLVHRCSSGKKRSIYLVSKRTRDFIIANREEPGKSEFIKLINGGMRLFIRADTESGFRISQDGVNEVLPYIKDDIKVPMNKDDLVALLKSRTVAIDVLSSAQHIRDKIKPGSFILVYKHKDEDATVEMPLVAWKGEYTIALYVANTYRVHLCALAQLRLGEEGALKDQREESKDIEQ